MVQLRPLYGNTPVFTICLSCKVQLFSNSVSRIRQMPSNIGACPCKRRRTSGKLLFPARGLASHLQQQIGRPRAGKCQSTRRLARPRQSTDAPRQGGRRGWRRDRREDPRLIISLRSQLAPTTNTPLTAQWRAPRAIAHTKFMSHVTTVTREPHVRYL